MDLDADIDTMLADFGELMSFGVFTGKCLVDIADQDMVPTFTAALGEVRIVTVRTSAFPGIAVGSTVSIGGISYQVKDRKRIADGRLTMIALGAA